MAQVLHFCRSPQGRCRIILAQIRSFESVPSLISAFVLSDFLLLHRFADVFSYSFNLSIHMRRYNEIWKFSLDGIPVFYCLSYGPLLLFFKVSSASLISQSGSFALPAVMRCRGIALFSWSADWWATMDTASGPGVRGSSFREISQSIKIIYRFPTYPLIFKCLFLALLSIFLFRA